MVTGDPYSRNEPSSRRSSTRSRADSFPRSCCLSCRLAPADVPFFGAAQGLKIAGPPLEATAVSMQGTHLRKRLPSPSLLRGRQETSAATELESREYRPRSRFHVTSGVRRTTVSGPVGLGRVVPDETRICCDRDPAMSCEQRHLNRTIVRAVRRRMSYPPAECMRCAKHCRRGPDVDGLALPRKSVIQYCTFSTRCDPIEHAAESDCGHPSA